MEKNFHFLIVVLLVHHCSVGGNAEISKSPGTERFTGAGGEFGLGGRLPLNPLHHNNTTTMTTATAPAVTKRATGPFRDTPTFYPSRIRPSDNVSHTFGTFNNITTPTPNNQTHRLLVYSKKEFSINSDVQSASVPPLPTVELPPHLAGLRGFRRRPVNLGNPRPPPQWSGYSTKLLANASRFIDPHRRNFSDARSGSKLQQTNIPGISLPVNDPFRNPQPIFVQPPHRFNGSFQPDATSPQNFHGRQQVPLLDTQTPQPTSFLVHHSSPFGPVTPQQLGFGSHRQTLPPPTFPKASLKAPNQGTFGRAHLNPWSLAAQGLFPPTESLFNVKTPQRPAGHSTPQHHSAHSGHHGIDHSHKTAAHSSDHSHDAHRSDHSSHQTATHRSDHSHKTVVNRTDHFHELSNHTEQGWVRPLVRQFPPPDPPLTGVDALRQFEIVRSHSEPSGSNFAHGTSITLGHKRSHAPWGSQGNAGADPRFRSAPFDRSNLAQFGAVPSQQAVGFGGSLNFLNTHSHSPSHLPHVPPRFQPGFKATAPGVQAIPQVPVPKRRKPQHGEVSQLLNLPPIDSLPPVPPPWNQNRHFTQPRYKTAILGQNDGFASHFQQPTVHSSGNAVGNTRAPQQNRVTRTPPRTTQSFIQPGGFDSSTPPSIIYHGRFGGPVNRGIPKAGQKASFPGVAWPQPGYRASIPLVTGSQPGYGGSTALPRGAYLPNLATQAPQVQFRVNQRPGGASGYSAGVRTSYNPHSMGYPSWQRPQQPRQPPNYGNYYPGYPGAGRHGSNRFGLRTSLNQGPSQAPFRPTLPPITTARECFLKFPNSIIVNVAPIERVLPITEEQCLRRCLNSAAEIKHQCKAAVYVPKYRSCDLFRQDASQLPARIIMLFGYHYYTPTPRCASLPFVVQATPKPFRPQPPPVRSPKVVSKPRPSISVTPRFVTTTPKPEPEILPDSDGCPRGTEAVFQRAEGFELIGSDGYTTNGISEAECVTSCRKNTSPDGIPYECLSADYFLDTETCILTSEAASPARAGVLGENPNSIYYEKTCLPDAHAAQCRGRDIDRQSQTVMLGFGETVESVETLEDCIQLCFKSEVQFGFACLSALYFYEEPDLNCLLNTESRITQPNFIGSEEDSRVEYFGIDSCMGADDEEKNFEISGKLSERQKQTKGLPNGRTTLEMSEDDPRFGIPSISLQELPRTKAKPRTLRVRQPIRKRKLQETDKISPPNFARTSPAPGFNIRLKGVSFKRKTSPEIHSGVSLKKLQVIEQPDSRFKKLGLATEDLIEFMNSVTRKLKKISRRKNDFFFRKALINGRKSKKIPSLSAESGREMADRFVVLGDWLAWGSCDRTTNGRRLRYRRCNAPKVDLCPFETEWCNTNSIKGGTDRHENLKS